MTTPVTVPIQHSIRKPITSRQKKKLERAHRNLIKAQREIVERSPDAAAILFPKSGPLVLDPAKLIEEYLANQHHLRETTKKERRDMLRNQFLRFFGPRQLSRELVEEWNRELHKSDYAPGTKWNVGSVVATMLRWAYETRRLPDDFRLGIRFPPAPQQQARAPYTKEEFDLLVDMAGDRPLRFMIVLGWHTGFAIVDTCNLEWRHVDMKGLMIRKPRQKTGEGAHIPIEPGSDLYLALKRQEAETLHIFKQILPGYPVCKEMYQNKRSMGVMFKDLVISSGIPYRSFHSFRSTMLSNLATNKNFNPIVACRIAGLRSLDTFAKYVTVSDADVRSQMKNVR